MKLEIKYKKKKTYKIKNTGKKHNVQIRNHWSPNKSNAKF